MQLTNPRAVDNQIWSWKANFDGGQSLAAQKRQTESNALTAERQDAGGVAIPDIPLGGITFSDNPQQGEYPILDACTIKAYNGLGSAKNGVGVGNHHFAEWDAGTNSWIFYDVNFYGSTNEYIKKVCEAYLEDPYEDE